MFNKNRYLRQGCLLATPLLVALISFTSCGTKDETFTRTISKGKSLYLEDALKYYDKHHIFNGVAYDSELLQLEFRKAFNHQLSKENATQEALINKHLIVFNIKDYSIDSSKGKYSTMTNAVLQPCSFPKKYDKYSDYPIFNAIHDSQISKSIKQENKNYNEINIYFIIEDLKKLDYISLDKDKQEDLCLFEKRKTGGMGHDVSIISNDLVYTAKEINEIMNKYEGLR